MVYGDAQRFWGAFSSILVYQWGGFEIVPGILMTPYFCDGMTMGCFLMKMIIMGHHFSKNGIAIGWFSHTSEV